MKHVHHIAPRHYWLGALALLAAAGCSKSDDDGLANYYLSGRVLDGSSLSPIGEAELALHVGDSTRRVRSEQDGSFSIGPIAPQSEYRLAATLDGYDEFSFYGSRLPMLDDATDRDRSVVGDVVLFSSGGQSPAFVVQAGSRDARMPMDPSSSEVRFLPRRLGVDPAIASADGPADAGPLIGSSPTRLPNHALGDVRPYRAPIVDGMAEIPQGALRFGATYEMEVYGGPSLLPENLSVEAARAADVDVWLAPSTSAAGSDLPNQDAEYFTGRIYDGVSLGRLTDYSIRLEYFDRSIPGQVGEDGRYFLGPLLANADYTIVVESEGYRSFLSHNEHIDASAGSSLMSLYYDAFLYPDGVQAPAATCRVRLSDGTELPSGFMRFSPRSSSSLFDDADEQPVGIVSADRGRQVWGNDEDLQQRSLLREFEGGELALSTGDLTYGVNYAVTIFGVEGHEVLTGSYTAGVDGDRAWVLDPLSDEALSVAAKSNDELALSPSGQLEIRFNQPIALDPSVDVAAARRTLNDSFSIDSPDEDTDTEQNVLVDAGALTPPISPTYRGVNFAIEGDRLTLTWDSGTGLETSDADDPILSVTYGGLGSILVYPADATDPSPVTLSSLIGASATVQVSAQ